MQLAQMMPSNHVKSNSPVGHPAHYRWEEI